MSFLRHPEIYPTMSAAQGGLAAAPSIHRFDEFPAGYSSAGCSPAEPASAWPASPSIIEERKVGNGLPANGSLSLITLYHQRGAVQTVPVNSKLGTTFFH